MHYLERELLDLVKRDENVFQFLQDGSLDGLWYWDLENPSHEWMSPSFWKVFGYTPEDMPHDPAAWQEMIHPDDLQLALKNFEDHCADPAHPYDQVVRYTHKNGSEVTVRCRGLAIRDDSGKPLRMLGAHNDLTELKKSEAQLRLAHASLEEQFQEATAASTAKSNFLADMSHEIRTPLNGVVGLASALERTGLTNRQTEMVQAISSAGVQLLGLIEEILDIAQIEAGVSILKPAPLNVTKLLGDVCALNGPRLQKAGRKLVDDIAGADWPGATGDAQRIRQVLENLIGNAVKFSGTSDIRLRASVDNSNKGSPQLVLQVIDHGPGISDAEKPKIFERFTRGGSSDGVPDGLGLGLYLSRELCRLHDGDLTLSDTPGGGATFTATFCLGRPASETVKTTNHSTANPLAALAPLSILIAEDNELNRFVLESFFDDTGIEATFVENGETALKSLESTTFDIALIDVRTPVMDGLEFKRHYDVACSGPGKTPVPMATYSANALPEQLEAYLAAGFEAHLSKPITFDDLVGCLTTLKTAAAAARA